MQPIPGFTLTQSYLDTIIGRSDISSIPKRNTYTQYANALMSLATQEIDPEVSRETLQQNTILLITPTGSGSGILATSDGFFITSYHTLENSLPKFLSDTKLKINKKNQLDFMNSNLPYLIVDQNNNYFPLDTSFLLVDKNHDLALCKAMIPTSTNPLTYNLSNRPVQIDEQLTLYGMKPTLQQRSATIMTTTSPHISSCRSYPILNTFQAQGHVEQGYSGGPIVDQAGSLHGIISGYIPKQHQPSQPTQPAPRTIVCIPSLYATYLLGAVSVYFEKKAKPQNSSKQKTKTI